MANGFLLWFQNFLKGVNEAFNFLNTKIFANVPNIDDSLKNLTLLELIGIGGLTIFIVVALIKWLVS